MKPGGADFPPSPSCLKTWFKGRWRELPPSCLVTQWKHSQQGTHRCAHARTLTSTYPQKLRDTDKRVSLSKYPEVCMCASEWVVSSADGNKGRERMNRGGWWEASLCRLGQIVFPIRKKEHSLLSLCYSPWETETDFEGQLRERGCTVCLWWSVCVCVHIYIPTLPAVSSLFQFDSYTIQT